jgi:hypothetical protein
MDNQLAVTNVLVKTTIFARISKVCSGSGQMRDETKSRANSKRRAHPSAPGLQEGSAAYIDR